MAFTIRLELKLERALERHCKLTGLAKSKIVRRALVDFLSKDQLSTRETGNDLLGRYGSGSSDLSVTRQKRYAEFVVAKHMRSRG